MKLKCLIIITLILIPVAYGLIDCKGIMNPSDIPCSIISSWQYENACNTYTVSVFKSNTTLLDTRTMADYGLGKCNITFNYTAQDSYLLNFSSGDTAMIIIEGKDEMASLSVTLFFGAITFAFFYMGFKFNFSKNPVADLIFKRVLILGGMFLLTLDTAMIVTMADNAGLGINREIFRYMWGINWAIYLFMLWLFWTTLVNVLKMLENLTREKRMGNEKENEYV